MTSTTLSTLALPPVDTFSRAESLAQRFVGSGRALDPGHGAGRSFAGILGVAQGRTAAASSGANTAEVEAVKDARTSESREAAELMLASTFIEPVLKSLRENSQAAPPFAPTQGEKQMQALMDRQIAHDVVKGGNWAIVDRLAADLMKARGGA